MILTKTQVAYYEQFKSHNSIEEIAKSLGVQIQAVESKFRLLRSKGLITGTVVSYQVKDLPEVKIVETFGKRSKAVKNRDNEKLKKQVFNYVFHNNQKIKVESPMKVEPLEFTNDGWIKNVYPRFFTED